MTTETATSYRARRLIAVVLAVLVLMGMAFGVAHAEDAAHHGGSSLGAVADTAGADVASDDLAPVLSGVCTLVALCCSLALAFFGARRLLARAPGSGLRMPRAAAPEVVAMPVRRGPSLLMLSVSRT